MSTPDVAAWSPDVFIVIMFLVMLTVGFLRGGMADIKALIALGLATIAIPAFYPASRAVMSSTGILNEVTSTAMKLLPFLLVLVVAYAILAKFMPRSTGGQVSLMDGILGLGTAFVKAVFIVWLINWMLSLPYFTIFNGVSAWLSRSGLYKALSSVNIFHFIDKFL